LSSEQQRQPTDLAQTLQQASRNALFDTCRNMIFVKNDIRDIVVMLYTVFIFLVINLFVTVYCAVSVYQIKHSTTPSQSVQMEANQ
jgi:hypothetical protein